MVRVVTRVRNRAAPARFGSGMRQRSLLTLLLAALAGVLAIVPAAEARYRVGIGDQSAAMFEHPRFQQLELKRVRYLVPWDWRSHDWQVDEVTRFMDAARAARKDVLVTFTASRGCYDDGRYAKRRACRAPTVSAYKRAVKRFHDDFRWVRAYATWNEANDNSQPTEKKPKLAARYYKALRKVLRKPCRRCTIMAADVRDAGNMRRWLRAFMRKAGLSAKLWGLHNYSDVNRRRSRGTQAMLRTVPGQVWLTETGGLVKFLPSFRYNLKRAANRTAYMFKLADRYTKRRRGMKSKITRLYLYQWTGVERDARFDAGLVDPDGSVRPAYRTFKKQARKRPK